MQRYALFSAVGLVLCIAVGSLPARGGEPDISMVAEPATEKPAAADSSKFTYVIVHGAWGGGWAWREVDNLLSADGHKVYRPTLTGLGERVHLASPEIGLDTHIQDIVNVILYEELRDVVLVGHSYGGMVVGGVADRLPERIRRLVYLDAFVPQDGRSFNDIAGGRGQRVPDGFVVPGWNTPSTPPGDVPHPAKTLSDKIELKNPAAAKLPTVYVLTVDPGRQPSGDMFYRFYQQAETQGWITLRMEGDHNVQQSRPKELVELLERVPLEPGE
jgi:pimeloyl-ACP methyl ester carboxylesterase